MRGTLLVLWSWISVTASCSSAGNQTATRAPASHRLASSACPQDRGAGISNPPAACSQSTCRSGARETATATRARMIVACRTRVPGRTA
jgi:hypothetical protein